MAGIVFITGLQLIWCLLLFCPCSAAALLAANRLGQRQSQAALPRASDRHPPGQGIWGCVYVQTLSSLKAACQLWERCRRQAEPDLQHVEHVLCSGALCSDNIFTDLLIYQTEKMLCLGFACVGFHPGGASEDYLKERPYHHHHHHHQLPEIPSCLCLWPGALPRESQVKGNRVLQIKGVAALIVYLLQVLSPDILVTSSES